MKKILGVVGAFLLAICVGAALGAGVSGIFTQVNSINGYQVNGGAGSSTQALCGNGTYYSSPCYLTAGYGFSTAFSKTGSPGNYSIDLATTGVTAGAYSCTNLTVDAYGRITGAATGSCPSTFPQWLYGASTCTPPTSTDGACTGSFSLSPGYSDTNYGVNLQMYSTGGAYMSITVTGKTTTTISYALSCSFNCSSYGTLSADVETYHP